MEFFSFQNLNPTSPIIKPHSFSLKTRNNFSSRLSKSWWSTSTLIVIQSKVQSHKAGFSSKKDQVRSQNLELSNEEKAKWEYSEKRCEWDWGSIKQWTHQRNGSERRVSWRVYEIRRELGRELSPWISRAPPWTRTPWSRSRLFARVMQNLIIFFLMLVTHSS